MALTPKRLFLSLCISISLLRPYTVFSRSPLVFKTLFENACELEWVVLYFKVRNERLTVLKRDVNETFPSDSEKDNVWTEMSSAYMYKGGQWSRCEELGACVRRGMHVYDYRCRCEDTDTGAGIS